VIEILGKAVYDFLVILPILLIAVFISQIINHYISRKKLDNKIKSKTNIVQASLVGVATPGPLIAFLPLLKVLKEKKVSLGVIVAFMTGQTLIGPIRIFLETSYFGIWFFLAKLTISIFIAISIGITFLFLEKKVSF